MDTSPPARDIRHGALALDADDVALIERSLTLHPGALYAAVRRAFERLLHEDTDARQAFGTVNVEQHLVGLGAAVLSSIRASRPGDPMFASLTRLAERHVRYGARPKQFERLAELVHIEFQASFAGDPECERYVTAWRGALNTLAGAMCAPQR